MRVKRDNPHHLPIRAMHKPPHRRQRRALIVSASVDARLCQCTGPDQRAMLPRCPVTAPGMRSHQHRDGRIYVAAAIEDEYGQPIALGLADDEEQST